MTTHIYKSLAAMACLLPVAASAAVSTTISYDSERLASAKYLVDSSITTSDANQVFLNEGDMPSPPQGQSTSDFIQVSGHATESGNLGTSTFLTTGGRAFSSASWDSQFVNDTGSAQQYSLNLALSQMLLKVGGYTADASTRDYRAGFNAEVTVNGKVVWSSTRELLQNSAGVSFLAAGQALGTENFFRNENTNGYSTLKVGNYSGAVGLGTFSDGSAVAVRYTLSSFSYWDDPDGCSGECGSVSATISDPLQIGAQRISAVSAVPEPASYAMLSLGIGALLLMGRRGSRGAIETSVNGRGFRQTFRMNAATFRDA